MYDIIGIGHVSTNKMVSLAADSRYYGMRAVNRAPHITGCSSFNQIIVAVLLLVQYIPMLLWPVGQCAGDQIRKGQRWEWEE